MTGSGRRDSVLCPGIYACADLILLDEDQDHSRGSGVRPHQFLPELAWGGGPCETWWRGRFGIAEPDPEQGMAEMSEQFRQRGGEIYIPSGGVMIA